MEAGQGIVWKEIKDSGGRIRTIKGIRAALLENSPRLQRVARFLGDGKPHTTREIIRACDVCAVNSIADELRHEKNGFEIDCKRINKTTWEYTMTGGIANLTRINIDI